VVFPGKGAWSGLLRRAEIQPLRFVWSNTYLHSYGEPAAKTHYLHSGKGGEQSCRTCHCRKK